MDCMESGRPDGCMTLPVDILCEPRETGCAQPQAYLRMELSPLQTRLTPVGDWDAEMLLEGLPRALLVAEPRPRLAIMFHEMNHFEDFFLSVLMVLLRRHSQNFQSIVLDGLPFWAGARISQSQWETLFGEGCVVEVSPGKVRVHHCNH